MDLRDKEDILYNKIFELQKGDENDQSFAFECIGYLGNESINDSLEKRLTILEEKIRKYLEEKNNNHF